MAVDFVLGVGGLRIGIHSQPAALSAELQKRYRTFLCAEPEEFVLDLKWLAPVATPAFLYAHPVFDGKNAAFRDQNFKGVIDLDRGHAWLKFASQHLVEEAEYFIRVVCALLAFERGGMLFHAAGVQRDGKGYAFFGLSGSGKTTVARNSPTGSVLNDDLLLLQPQAVGWRMDATPFWNPTQVTPQLCSAPLAALLRLVQAKSVSLEKLPGALAYAELVANAPIINSNPDQAGALLGRVGQLLAQVPAYKLNFLPDDSFWRVVLPLGK